jgi:hypothetical protein
MRSMAENANCTFDSCHIPFEASPGKFENLGVILYGGGLVDPRAYSVLAEPLSEMGLTTVIPVFANDLAFAIPCGSGRIQFAQEAYPMIDQWILVGHSFGGVGAMSDAWVQLELEETYNTTDISAVAGVVLLAADVQPNVCGPMASSIDFSTTDLPMAAVTATEDAIVNMTRWEENTVYLSNDTIFESIEGGNHGQFGSYNDTLRLPILGQMDGEATISPEAQWDATIDVILQIAMMVSGGDLPTVEPTVLDPTETMAPTISRAGNGFKSMTGLVPGMIAALLVVFQF